MKVLQLRRGRRPPPSMEADPRTAAVEGEERQASANWTGGRRAAAVAAGALLRSALLAGPLALLLALWQLLTPAGPTIARPSAASSLPALAEQAAVGQFAERYVATWLRATRTDDEELSTYIDLAAASLPAQPLTAGEPAVARVERVEPGMWSLTVGALVQAPTPEDAAEPTAAALRYFDVSVRYADGALAALTLPGPTAAPPRMAPLPLAYRYRLPSGHPVSMAAEGFLAALLAGDGDVTRYTAPGSGITAVTPAPYAEVKLTGIQLVHEPPAPDLAPPTGAALQALLTATVGRIDGEQTTVQYPVTFVARDGRWELRAIDPVPASSTPSATPSPTTSPTPRSSH